MTKKKAITFSLILSLISAVIISYLPGIDGARSITVGKETFVADLYNSKGVPFLWHANYGDFGSYENDGNAVINIAFWMPVLYYPAFIILRPIRRRPTTSTANSPSEQPHPSSILH